MYYESYRRKNDNPFYTLYTVKQGDTLYNISKEKNINTNLLAELNGLNTIDYIYPDQIIKVPNKGVKFYITKEDDTLREVSKIFKVKEETLVNQNREIYLLPGQMIYYKE